MPERLRRHALVATLATAVATFALALFGIATTEGRLEPDGQAAATARQQAVERVVSDCPWKHSDQEL